MTIIEASSGTYRSRVDGTLVLSVEIEPRFAKDAIALFGGHGTAMALAALKPATSKPAEREQLGALCWWAVQRCKEPEFRKWLCGPQSDDADTMTEYLAARLIYSICRITSRKELDTNEEAAAIFRAKVMAPYRAHLKRQGATA